MPLALFPRKFCLFQSQNIFAYVFLQELCSSGFYVWCEIWINIFLKYRYPVDPAPFVEDSFLSPLNCIGFFVKIHLAMYVWG